MINGLRDRTRGTNAAALSQVFYTHYTVLHIFYTAYTKARTLSPEAPYHTVSRQYAWTLLAGSF